MVRAERVVKATCEALWTRDGVVPVDFKSFEFDRGAAIMRIVSSTFATMRMAIPNHRRNAQVLKQLRRSRYDLMTLSH